MKKPALLLICLLLLFPLLSPAEEEAVLPDTWYELSPLVQKEEGEAAMLLLPRSYYSGEQIYKGNTGLPLSGACVLHCASVVLSNLSGQEITGQEVTAANNRDIREPRRWVNYVSWGKLATRYQVDFYSYDLAQYNTNLKNSGIRKDERRHNKIETLAEAMNQLGGNAGLILHFNVSGRLNGSGHRHAVVLLGYILKDRQVTDLLISDSNVPAPQGACVRLSQSSLPLSMLGKKALNKAVENGDNLALLMMDYVVSYRYVKKAAEP